MSAALSQEALRALADGWIKSGRKVIGPVEAQPGRIVFKPLGSGAALYLGAWAPTVNSIKEAVLPRHEKLYSYRIHKDGIQLMDEPEAAGETIVIAAHPCQAAALPVLDKVFNWDLADEFYNRRRAALSVVTLACSSYDDHCFCTSVGLGPASEKGSDAMLYETGGEFVARTFTAKGRALFGDAAEEAPPQHDGPPVRFRAARAREFARKEFDSPFWREHSLACLGCGVCAYVCPACHCFDIVDERRGDEGFRARNWDACQFPMFTLHASGHNPRQRQGDRQRQRIYHKFGVYPEKFGEILCTGCGACARNCPAGLGVLPMVTEIPDAEPLQA
ncbi:MAG TPA: 4Fe-4S dicluster domain-containing protein [Bryobacteraceae bacterium]|nr:4Fe-4S dicluster domain-containing protein [Bryobacteraceae bacterium]